MSVQIDSSDEDEDAEVFPTANIYMVPLESLHPIVRAFRLGTPIVVCQILMTLIPTVQEPQCNAASSPGVVNHCPNSV